MRIAFVGPFGLHPNKTMGSRAMGLARALVRSGNQVVPWLRRLRDRKGGAKGTS